MCPVGKASGLGRGGACPLIERSRRAGEFIYLQDEPAGQLWFVKRGTVVLLREATVTDGPGGAWAIRRDGAFLGLESLVRRTYLDSAKVVTDARICGGARDVVSRWLAPLGTPDRMLLEQALDMACQDTPRGAAPDGNAVRRVARWILREGDVVHGVVPRRLMAGMLGMVPETLSRALSRLSQLGAIEHTRRVIRVRDSSALRNAAGIDEDTGDSSPDEIHPFALSRAR